MKRAPGWGILEVVLALILMALVCAIVWVLAAPPAWAINRGDMPTETSTFDSWKLLESAYGIIIVLLAWWGNRMTDRLDVLEKSAVSRGELKEQFEQMRQDRKTMHDDNRAALQRIEEKLQETQQVGIIPTRVQRIEEDIDDLRHWKHSVDPFITRHVEP